MTVRPAILTICAGLIMMLDLDTSAKTDLVPIAGVRQDDAAREFTHGFLFDRIHGGWVGMLIGGLEGLPHEFKYKEQPRDTLPEFAFLPDGARSDDDNDFEWTHLWFMDREGVRWNAISETWISPWCSTIGAWRWLP